MAVPSTPPGGADEALGKALRAESRQSAGTVRGERLGETLAETAAGAPSCMAAPGRATPAALSLPVLDEAAAMTARALELMNRHYAESRDAQQLRAMIQDIMGRLSQLRDAAGVRPAERVSLEVLVAEMRNLLVSVDGRDALEQVLGSLKSVTVRMQRLREIPYRMDADAPVDQACETAQSVHMMASHPFRQVHVASGSELTNLCPPDLPAKYCERPIEIAAVEGMLMAASQAPSHAVNPVVLRGLGGVGKTVLAQAVAHRALDPSRHSSGGLCFGRVLWFCVGHQPVTLQLQRMLVHSLVGTAPAIETVAQGMMAVADCTHRTPVLLVLDDVWDASVVEAFATLGPQSRLLVTTRKGNVAATGRTFSVDAWPTDDGLRLLASYAECPVDELCGNRCAAHLVCDVCAGNALAIRLVGSEMADVSTADRRAILAEAAHRGHLHPSASRRVNDVLRRSFADISVHVQTCTDLALLPGNVDIPAEFARLVFCDSDLARLECAGLLTPVVENEVVVAYRVHRRVVECAGDELDRLDTSSVRRHAWLERLRTRCGDAQPTAWWSVASLGPSTTRFRGFALDAIWRLLRDTRQTAEMVRLCATYEWMHARCMHGDLMDIVGDFNDVRHIPVDDATAYALRMASQAYTLSLAALRVDRSLLPGQIVGRAHPDTLRDFTTWMGFIRRPAKSNTYWTAFVRRAIEMADAQAGPWLCPRRPCLTPVGSAQVLEVPLVREVRGLAVASGGRLLVSGSEDGTIIVWELASGAHVRALSGHSKRVWSVAVMSDGQRVVSGSEDKTVCVWNLESGACLCTSIGHTNWVLSVAALPDECGFVSGSRDKTVRVWEPVHGACTHVLEGHASEVNSVAVTPDGRHIVSGSDDKTVRVWEAQSGACFRTLHGHTDWVESVAVTPDGWHIVSGSEDKTVRLWDWTSGVCVRTLVGHTASVHGLAVTPDARHIVSGSWDGTVCVWNVASGARVRTLHGHLDRVTDVAVTPDGRGIVSSSDDRTMRVWQLDREDVRADALDRHTGRIQSAILTPDKRYMVSGSKDRTVRVWDAASGACVRTLRGHAEAVLCVAVSPNGQLAISGSQDKTVRVWALPSGECQRTLTGHAWNVTCVTVAPDGRFVVSGSWDATLRVWTVADGACTRVLEGHTDRVECVAVTPDGRNIVSGSQDRTVRVWDLARGSCTHVLNGHPWSVHCLTITPDGQYIVSGSLDRTLCVWDVAIGQCWLHIEGCTFETSRVGVTADGRHIVSRARDGVAAHEFHRGHEADASQVDHAVLDRAAGDAHLRVAACGRRIVATCDDAAAAVFVADMDIHVVAHAMNSVVAFDAGGRCVVLEWRHSRADRVDGRGRQTVARTH